jgi:hypothetical protein
MAREVGKDPLDLIGMLDDTIEETLRNSNRQSQREIFQAVEDSIERFRRNLNQGEARTDFISVQTQKPTLALSLLHHARKAAQGNSYWRQESAGR